MKTLILCLSVLCLALSPCLSAQDAAPDTTQAPPQVKFEFSSDWNRFRAQDSLIYIEYTAAIARTVLSYQKQEDDTYAAEFIVESKIMLGDSVVNQKNWRTRDTMEELSAQAMSLIIPIINYFIVPEGQYTLDIKITDKFGNGRAQSTKFEIDAFDFGDELNLSDTQLATTIQSDNGDSPFVKNGYKVMPNPSALYGIGVPMLYTYTEIYNLADATSDEGGKYTMSYRVLNNDGAEVKTFPDRVRNKPGASSVAVNQLNVVTLISDTYTLETTVTDHETGAGASTSRKFFVYRQDDFAEGSASFQKLDTQTGAGSPGLDASRYDTLTEEELDLEFDQAQYIAERDERRTWKKLNLDGKREYIKEFWAGRDPSPATPENEFKSEYFGRLELVNQMFRGTFREGWKSDRGRVMLLYGRPDEIERFPGGGDSKEYHFWNYFSIQGGVQFVFVDKRGMHDLELVHSTARGEVYDPQWTRWVDPNY